MPTNSILKAIGMSLREGDYRVQFYYQIVGGGRDITMPSWELPARSWNHMQEVVRAFNEG